MKEKPWLPISPIHYGETFSPVKQFISFLNFNFVGFVAKASSLPMCMMDQTNLCLWTMRNSSLPFERILWENKTERERESKKEKNQWDRISMRNAFFETLFGNIQFILDGSNVFVNRSEWRDNSKFFLIIHKSCYSFKLWKNWIDRNSQYLSWFYRLN